MILQGRSQREGGGRGAMAPPLQFSIQTKPSSFSFKHEGYCFLMVFRNYTDQKFQDFYSVCYDFRTIYDEF